MPSDTKVIPHQWVEFKMTQVQRVEIEGISHFVPDPLHDPQITYGCGVCDMGFNNAQGTGCPGPNLSEDPDGS